MWCRESRKLIICVCVSASLLYLAIVHTTNSSTGEQTSVENKPKRSETTCNAGTSNTGLCNNKVSERLARLLTCVTTGAWHPRQNVTQTERAREEEMNAEVREMKGWPRQVWREDGRCGDKFPLPRRQAQHGNFYMHMDVTSQCSPTSTEPCCRHDEGRCGTGPAFCACEHHCEDYTGYFNAAFSAWVPLDSKCYAEAEPLVVESGDTMCEEMADTFSSTTFIGDSLVRHIFSASLIHLSNDLHTGALKANLSQQTYKGCGGEKQFADSWCHRHLAMTWKEVREKPLYCGATSQKPVIRFVQAYNAQRGSAALKAVTDVASESRPLVAIGVGIHNNFNSSQIVDEYLEPILRVTKTRQNIVLIWLSTHAAGPLKPMQYRATQGNDKILQYNEQIRTYLQARGVPMFDTFKMTEKAHSFDGTHQGSTVNLLKAKLLLESALQAVNGAR